MSGIHSNYDSVCFIYGMFRYGQCYFFGMLATATVFKSPFRRASMLRLGYVRLLDAAPLIVAESLGLFREADLDVSLSREAGWATIRDKLALGELDVVQALSPFPFTMRLGIGVAPTDVVAGMVLSCNGNAITLSSDLLEEGIEDGKSLARYIRHGYRPRKLALGVVSLYSSHHFMLCRWLESAGIDPKKDVVIIVLPPEQMVRNLASGNIDGFSVGEPWNSIAVEDECGWCPTTSSQIYEPYPEKVLATTERFLAYRPQEYHRMIQVLIKACEFCADAANRPRLLEILSSSQYLDCSSEALSNALGGSFPLGAGRDYNGTFIHFSGSDINRPDARRAEVVWEDFRRYTANDKARSASSSMIAKAYREDLYEQALSGQTDF
ncbi:MAG: nitrate ABC transporter ATP-binding protein [Puniceicoccaceae bacterium MED-G30]|jgi:ABC-type nitrate/sulfonate/bicarbonate transport system substrate-binding protein|nr:MAG: nitrate ABC transporter ATP-binding protein [Puniceicoccaceae bacterium MED-G30]RPG87180.1 MAG: nitrate ABC transporter ATP-binding protein [Coraliomargarita sp. TMED73]